MSEWAKVIGNHHRQLRPWMAMAISYNCLQMGLSWLVYIYIIIGWWFGTMEFGLTFHRLGTNRSQLTHIFQRGRYTVYHQPTISYSCKWDYTFYITDQGMIEGSLEVKLPTIWRDEKAVSREKSQPEEKRSEERRCRCAKR